MAGLLTLPTKGGPGSESRNTFNLPTGTDIQAELVAIFRDQHAAILAFLDKSKSWDRLELKWGLPLSWPSWDSLGLGVSNFIERLEDSIKSIWEKAGAGFLALLGLDPDGWNPNDPKNIALIQKGLQDLATEVNDTTSQQLQVALDTVSGEVVNGQITMDQAEAELAKDVDDIFGAAETWRAKRIARTEASRAYHEAIAAAAREFGDVVGWKWVCAEGACPICLEIEAECQFVPEGRPFAIIGDNSTYQTIDMPPAHPNCACTAEPVMADDVPSDWGDTLIQPTGTGAGITLIRPKPQPTPAPQPTPKPVKRNRLLKGDALIEEVHSILQSMGVMSQSGTIAQIEAAMPNHLLTDKMPAMFDPKTGKVWINTEATYWANPAKVLKLSKQQHWFAVNTPEQIAYHEGVHLLHFQKILAAEGGDQAKAIKRMGEMTMTEFPIPLRRTIQKQVGRYAALNESEFVAEVGGAIRQGKTYSDEIMSLYRELLGP